MEREVNIERKNLRGLVFHNINSIMAGTQALPKGLMGKEKRPDDGILEVHGANSLRSF